MLLPLLAPHFSLSRSDMTRGRGAAHEEWKELREGDECIEGQDSREERERESVMLSDNREKSHRG